MKKQLMSISECLPKQSFEKKISLEKLKEMTEAVFKKAESQHAMRFKYEVFRWEDKDELFEAHTFTTPNGTITTGRSGAELFDREMKRQFEKSNLLIINENI